MTYGEEFHLRIERRGTTLLLRLAGEFDWCVVGHVEAALGEAADLAARHVVFDLREVTFLDVAGLTALIRAQERSRNQSFDVCVVPPAGQARRVFTLTRAGLLLTLVDDVPDPPNRSRRRIAGRKRARRHLGVRTQPSPPRP